LNVTVMIHCIWEPVVLTFNLHTEDVSMVVLCGVKIILLMNDVCCVEVNVLRVGHGKSHP